MTCKNCGMTFPVISNRGDSEAVKFKAKRLGHEQGSTVDLPAYRDSTQSAVGWMLIVRCQAVCATWTS